MKEISRREFIRFSTLAAAGGLLQGCKLFPEPGPSVPTTPATLTPEQMCPRGFIEPGSVRVFNLTGRLGSNEEPEYQAQCNTFKNDLFTFVKENGFFTEKELPETMLTIYQTDEGNSAMIFSSDRGYLVRKNDSEFEISRPLQIFDVDGLDYVQD